MEMESASGYSVSSLLCEYRQCFSFGSDMSYKSIDVLQVELRRQLKALLSKIWFEVNFVKE